MKIMFCIFMSASIIFSGCAHDNLYKFDHKSLLAKLEKSGFAPELPTELPFKVKSTHITEASQPNNKIYTIDFHGTKGEYLSLQMFNGKNVRNESDFNWEKVKLAKVNGFYGKNKDGALVLDWAHNKIHYDLTYYSKQSKKDISKSDMINSVKSFN